MSPLNSLSSRLGVRVGILHSQSGTMALSESPLIDGTLMAIAQINQAGGVLGQLIVPMVVDGASHPAEFERQARNLIQSQGVTHVFGCWTSATRKAVKPVFEAFNALLWYPLQYEGLESSPNIFYTGSCPNQQVAPAIGWLLSHRGKRFYLIGSDYVFPRTVNQLITVELKQQGGEVLGENYVELGESNFTEAIAQIQQVRPDVVFNTLNGDSNQAFYRQYRDAGITADEIPILAVSVAEAELQSIGDAAIGHYASWSYFQSINTPENQKFVQEFQAEFGVHRVTSDPIAAAYSQVYLWKQAVEAAQSFQVDRVRQAAYGQSFASPGGLIKIEPNHHVWKNCYIGRILPNGQFAIVFSSQGAIKPLPWLGVEELKFDKSELVIEMLAQVSQGIQQTWLSEQKSRQLEALTQELQGEIAQRQQAEIALNRSEERWQLALRGTGDGIFDWNIITGEAFASARLLEMLGYTEQNLSLSYETWHNLLHPEDIVPTQTALQAHLEGKTALYRAEYRLRCQDGSYKWILARGQAQWDQKGQPVRMLGSHQDISDRKQVEEEVQLLLTISQAISAAPDFDTALEVALQQVCQITNWIYGEAWIPKNNDATLIYSPRWYCYYHGTDPTVIAAMERFREYSEILTFSPGEEIPGQVWLTQQFQWISPLSEIEDVLLRLELATECGLKAGCGLPILVMGNQNQKIQEQESHLLSSQSPVLAVLVFFTRETRSEDQRLFKLVNAVAAQLGTVLQQKKVQAEMNALFAAMTDRVTVRDASGRCLNVVPTNTKILAQPLAGMIGRRLHDDLPPKQADQILRGILHAVSRQETVVIEYSLPVGGQEVWLEETISPLSEETAILVARDISDAYREAAQRQQAEEALRLEQEKSDKLLRNILPEAIANQLKQNPGAIAEQFNEVTILFADLVGFTPLSARLTPIELVNLLNQIFSTFDELAEDLGLEKIKTIGDAYMVAAGLPIPRTDHAEAIAQMALAMQATVDNFHSQQNENIQLRIGINTGVVVAGVIGTKKFIYDLWGDAVNIASRMESSGQPGSIQVTTATYERLKDKFVFEKRGNIHIKGKGEMVTYWLIANC